MNAVKIYEDACRAADRSEITIGEFEKRIEPLKDVESVVRCKDCKYATMTSDGQTCKYCEIDTDDDGYIRAVYHNADWFCADGKRREDDGTTEGAEPEADMVS